MLGAILERSVTSVTKPKIAVYVPQQYKGSKCYEEKLNLKQVEGGQEAGSAREQVVISHRVIREGILSEKLRG